MGSHYVAVSQILIGDVDPKLVALNNRKINTYECCSGECQSKSRLNYIKKASYMFCFKHVFDVLAVSLRYGELNGAGPKIRGG